MDDLDALFDDEPSVVKSATVAEPTPSATESGEDAHFYLDNAPPVEVLHVLQVLAPDVGQTPKEIAETIFDRHGFKMQSDCTYSPRRLFDLGCAHQERQGPRLLYRLSQRGARLQSLLSFDRTLALDSLHFAHFAGYRKQPTDRKYLWSYRRCCERLWGAGRIVPAKTLATEVQAAMRTEFPHLDDSSRNGGRFDVTGAGRVNTWLRALEPSPLGEDGKTLTPRAVVRPELALLAISDLYRTRGYQLGDGVVLDEPLWHELAGVFFLDEASARESLNLAARTGDTVTWRDTLAGPSIVLRREMTLDDM